MPSPGHTLDETLQDVKDEGTLQGSLIALFQGVEAQLKDLLAGTTIAPAVQAKIDAMFDQIEANKAQVAAAIAAGTPIPPAVVNEPPANP